MPVLSYPATMCHDEKQCSIFLIAVCGFWRLLVLRSPSSWGCFPKCAAVYKHLSSVGGPKNGYRTLDGVSQVLRTVGTNIPLDFLNVLLLLHLEVLDPLCCQDTMLVYAQLTTYQQPHVRLSRDAALPVRSQPLSFKQRCFSAVTTCRALVPRLFPRLHAFVCIHLGWVSFHPVLSFLCSYSHQCASLAVQPYLPLSHLTVGCSISPLMLLVESSPQQAGHPAVGEDAFVPLCQLDPTTPQQPSTLRDPVVTKSKSLLTTSVVQPGIDLQGIRAPSPAFILQQQDKGDTK